MKVRVLFFASLREKAGTGAAEEEVEAGATVADLWERIKSRPGFEGTTRAPGYAVNGEWCGGTRQLQAGDEVALLPPVSGG